MSGILAGITSLVQHVHHLNSNHNDYRPDQCFNCHKAGLWKHGCYGRTADQNKNNKENMNPVLVPRFICPHCRKTCSTLPECIPPRRWYLWTIQQVILLALLVGESLPPRNLSQHPGRATILRWWNWFQEKFVLHAGILRSNDPELGRFPEFREFWQACLTKMSLSKAMYLLHKGGLVIP